MEIWNNHFGFKRANKPCLLTLCILLQGKENHSNDSILFVDDYDGGEYDDKNDIGKR